MIAVLLFIASAYADDAPYALNKKFELSPPPAAGSIEEKSDFAELENIQKTRTPQECQRAQSERKITLASFFGPPYGPLTIEQVLKAEHIYSRLLKTSGGVVHQIKEKWGRPRPYEVDKKLTPCIDKEPSRAYPSGHAEIAAMTSDLLSQLYPEHKKEIEARALVIAHDRVLGGVHHPTDIRAGLELGHELFSEISKDRAFQADLKAARR